MDKEKIILSAAIILIIIISAILFVFFSPEYIQPQEPLKVSSITVDFSVNNGEIMHSASGFLHNPKSLDWPPKETIAQVKPKQVRMPRELYFQEGMKEYLENDLNIKSETLLISAGVMTNNYWPGDNNNWEPYKEMLIDLIKESKQRGYDFEYEIWNEPNGALVYWPKSDKEFFETWRYAVKLLKKIDPTIQVMGPSMANFEGMCDYDADGDGKIESYMDEFLGYAKANDVVPDILSWHELNLDPEIWIPKSKNESGATNIVPHVEYARKLIADLNLSIDKISINEYSADYVPEFGLTLNEKFNGAYAIQYFSALEEAKVDTALRGCWKDKDWLHPGNSCFDRMDNLITYEGKGRSNWYAYKYYAEMEGKLVEVKSEKGLAGIATLDKEKGIATLLMGTTNPVKAITINLRNLPIEFGTTVNVQIEQVKYSAMNAATSNEIINKEYLVNDGVLTINLTDAQEGDLYYIQIKKI